jgi:hypothetical protein
LSLSPNSRLQVSSFVLRFCLQLSLSSLVRVYASPHNLLASLYTTRHIQVLGLWHFVYTFRIGRLIVSCRLRECCTNPGNTTGLFRDPWTNLARIRLDFVFTDNTCSNILSITEFGKLRGFTCRRQKAKWGEKFVSGS